MPPALSSQQKPVKRFSSSTCASVRTSHGLFSADFLCQPHPHDYHCSWRSTANSCFSPGDSVIVREQPQVFTMGRKVISASQTCHAVVEYVHRRLSYSSFELCASSPPFPEVYLVSSIENRPLAVTPTIVVNSTSLEPQRAFANPIWANLPRPDSPQVHEEHGQREIVKTRAQVVAERTGGQAAPLGCPTKDRMNAWISLSGPKRSCCLRASSFLPAGYELWPSTPHASTGLNWLIVC